MADNLELATLGGGCFWCLEALYQEVKGVRRVVSGYAGGHLPNPTYKQVCAGTTGHAEVVQIAFDPTEISYADILYIFWHIHDPTTLNRQGNDVGTQYRSVIFYHDDSQRTIAEASKSEAFNAGLWPNPIVTEISPIPPFYEAESYHQNYLIQNPYQPYCVMVVNPKIQKFRRIFQDKLK